MTPHKSVRAEPGERKWAEKCQEARQVRGQQRRPFRASCRLVGKLDAISSCQPGSQRSSWRVHQPGNGLPKPNRPGKKRPTRKGMRVAWRSERMGPWSHCVRANGQKSAHERLESAYTSFPQAIPHVPANWLAHRFQNSRVREHPGGRSMSQRSWDAMGAHQRQSDAGVAQRRVQ